MCHEFCSGILCPVRIRIVHWIIELMKKYVFYFHIFGFGKFHGNICKAHYASLIIYIYVSFEKARLYI